MIRPFENLEEYEQAVQSGISDPEAYWADVARQFTWSRPWSTVLQWDFHRHLVRWFDGGELNITFNCLDRHLPAMARETALIWEPNDPDGAARRLSYGELHSEVERAAAALRRLGMGKGDRICVYMPMVPELAVAVLAIARIGAIHSVVFGGFSAHSLADRISDAGCRLVITADVILRGGKVLPCKAVVDEALSFCGGIENVLVLRHADHPVEWVAGRDLDWHEELDRYDGIGGGPEAMSSEDPLFILYTSGSTGKPKGVVHTCGGYMVYAGYSFAHVFRARPGEVFWCTADLGWITGHTYLLYGPLLQGITSLMFEGIPTWPHPDRFWRVCEKHGVNILYTAPTAIRSLMAAGDEWVRPHALNELRVLGSVGEPINAEAWQWYHREVGKGRCPVTDTWWQTETGGIMIAALAGLSPLKPTYAGRPLPGIQPVLLDSHGAVIEENDREGYLAIRFPWPSILRTTWGDHERCRQTYFGHYPGYYFTGDGARRDADGNYRIIGRVDDVLNVSGHRLGTAEIENAINMHPRVAESAVVGYPDDLKGQGIYAFVICRGAEPDSDMIRAEITHTVVDFIGKIARPDKIQLVSGLPKTRSGKIMRRILRKIAEGDVSYLGDTSTLLDPAVVEELVRGRL
jgi:acetyl-CoA synthetase